MDWALVSEALLRNPPHTTALPNVRAKPNAAHPREWGDDVKRFNSHVAQHTDERNI